MFIHIVTWRLPAAIAALRWRGLQSVAVLSADDHPRRVWQSVNHSLFNLLVSPVWSVCFFNFCSIRPRSISCVAVVVIRKSILLYFLLSTSFPLFVIAVQWVQKVGSVEFPKRNDDPFLAHGNIQSFFFLHKTFLPLFPFTLSLSLSAFVCVCVRVRSVFTLTANVASRSRRL